MSVLGLSSIFLMGFSYLKARADLFFFAMLGGRGMIDIRMMGMGSLICLAMVLGSM